MNISLKSASRGLTVVASLLCLGGVLSFVKSKQPLALNIIVASASVAISSELTSRNNHKKANEQLADIVTKYDKEWQVLNSKFEQQSKVLKETEALRDELQQEFAKASDTIILKNQTIEILQDKVNQLVVNFEERTQELDSKLQQDDMRYQELINVLKGLIFEHLNERIYKFFNSLDESISKKLESDDYQAIHDNLIPFKDKLQLHYDTHCELLKSIEEIDGELADIVTDILNIYSRIVDEQTALKTRFRNLLNLDERRSLEDAYNTLADYSKTHTPVTKAKDLLGEYNAFQKNQLNNLGEQLEDNVNSLSEMRGQVFDLIAQIEQIALEKVALKDELAKLNQPQTWRLAQGSNELTKGNIIINYFWSIGIKLDRAFTTGDVYEVKIYYHTDSNPRTIVFKELNDHSEALQQLCLTLKPITFDWDADKGLMVASLTWESEREGRKA
jgi:chromosome segregation ATPase